MLMEMQDGYRRSIPMIVFIFNEVFQLKGVLAELSMLCGDPLKKKTDRGSHQVT